MTVTAARPHVGRLLVVVEGVADRDGAEALRGTLLLAPEADLPPTEDPDEFYDHELEGLAVLTTDGTTIGVITEVLHGARQRPAPGAPRPAVGTCWCRSCNQIVPEVDVRGGRVVIDPPEGLLDEE